MARSVLAPALLSGALLAASPAVAVTSITFAQFFQSSPGTPVTYSGGSGAATITGTFPALATVLAFGVPGVYPVAATISASTTGAIVLVGADLQQDGWAGTISFDLGGSNFLTAAFMGGNLSVTTGPTQSAGLVVSGTCGTMLCYTSDPGPLGVSGLTIGNFALSFSGIEAVGAPGTRFGPGGGTFVASVSGTFAGAIPEPATWALLVAGFGLVGVMARRRAQAAIA